jgi:very-short-patch-repair endonuclease
MEQQLALALSAAEAFRWRQLDDHPWHVGSWPRLQIALLAQPQWDAYRADFALTPLDWLWPAPLPIVIEVDGFDHHERTKEQAERDRSRDRFMAAHGATVLRFTGSEVWRNAGKCAGEVLALAARSATGLR